jgi:hypothetical protein
MRARLVAAGFACAALAGCGGGGARPAAGAGDASTDATLADGAAHDGALADASSDGGAPHDGAGAADSGAGAAFCDATYGELRVAFEGCCTSGDTTTAQYKFIDAIYAALTKDCESALSSAIAKGRVTFDSTAAAACVAAFQQRIAQGNCWGDVDTNQPGPPIFGSSACSGVVVGLQAAGAPCAVDFECKDGLTCVGWTSATDGACTAPGASGKPCEQAADAGSALYVDWGFGNHPSCAAGSYCVTPTCKPQADAGASCTRDQACASPMICHLGACAATTVSSDGGACDGKIDCQQGLYCAPGDGGALPGTCLPRLPLGAECPPNGDACKGLCVPPDGGKTGVCTALCGSG